MIWVPEWLEKALGEFWVKEIPGEEHNKRILEYHAATTLKATADEIAWCSAFVCWSLEPKFNSTKSARARSHLGWGVPLEYPAHGCVTILKRGNEPQPGPEVLDAQGHVGFFVGFDINGNVKIWGGNQSNSVCESTYPVKNVLGHRWVK